MTSEDLINSIRKKNFLPLWKELQAQPNFYQRKIDALLLLLDWEQNPVRVTEGWGHHWIEADFVTGPVILDWNAWHYKCLLQRAREESGFILPLKHVLTPSKLKGEKILVIDKKAHWNNLQRYGLYATAQRTVSWKIKALMPLDLYRNLMIWPA